MVSLEILNKLTHLFKININIDKSTHINLNSKNAFTDKYYFSDKDNVLSINLNQLTPEEKTQISQILRKSVEDGIPLLEEKAKEITEDIFLKEHSSEEIPILEFFRDKISNDDYTALRASLYLRNRFREGAKRQEIDSLKTGIIQKYGKRGRNISDLCSAGYFEAFMNITKTMNIEGFSELYESIVGKGALTIFVSDMISPNQLIQEISKRINTNRKYGGAGVIQIHGIGRTNIETIKIAMDTIEDTFLKLIVKTSLENGFMVVTIKF